MNEGFHGETQLLMPVSLDLEVQRNLSSNWYHSIPDIKITAHLKPMIVSRMNRMDWLWWLAVSVSFVLFVLFCPFCFLWKIIDHNR